MEKVVLPKKRMAQSVSSAGITTSTKQQQRAIKSPRMSEGGNREPVDRSSPPPLVAESSGHQFVVPKPPLRPHNLPLLQIPQKSGRDNIDDASRYQNNEQDDEEEEEIVKLIDPNDPLDEEVSVGASQAFCMERPIGSAFVDNIRNGIGEHFHCQKWDLNQHKNRHLLVKDEANIPKAKVIMLQYKFPIKFYIAVNVFGPSFSEYDNKDKVFHKIELANLLQKHSANFLLAPIKHWKDETSRQTMLDILLNIALPDVTKLLKERPKLRRAINNLVGDPLQSFTRRLNSLMNNKNSMDKSKMGWYYLPLVKKYAPDELSKATIATQVQKVGFNPTTRKLEILNDRWENYPTPHNYHAYLLMSLNGFSATKLGGLKEIIKLQTVILEKSQLNELPEFSFDWDDTIPISRALYDPSRLPEEDQTDATTGQGGSSNEKTLLSEENVDVISAEEDNDD